MSDIKIQPSATGSATVTLTAPATGTARTVTLPDSTDTLAVNSDVTNKLPLAGGTMTGTIAGFTSTGIDDNATSTAITIDAAENVGIGVTPESWKSGFTALDIDSICLYDESSIAGGMPQNAYKSTSVGNWAYKNTNEASWYEQYNGKHIFSVAPSGTADSAISWTQGMTIDNSGRVAMPNQPSFRAYMTSNALTVGANTLFPFNGTEHNIGNYFNTSTYKFTVPVAGSYYFYFHTIVQGAHTNGQVAFDISTGINYGKHKHFSYTNTGWHGVDLGGVFKLAAGTTVCIRNSGGSSTFHGGSWASFSGYLIG